MKMRNGYVFLAMLCVIALSCMPTGTPPGATNTPTAASYIPPYTPGPGACEVVADGAATIYFRPSMLADVFSSFAAGDREAVSAFAAGGWVAFEPGIAQAGNTGVFRYRWVNLSEPVHLEGSCGSLTEVTPIPQPTTCYVMIGLDTPVYTNPDTSSPVLATMHYGDYAQLIERAPNWVKVDLSVGNLGTAGLGWIEESQVNITGHCDSVPTSTPSSALVYTPGAGACQIVADGPAAIYFRPSLSADVFGHFAAGDREDAMGYTADGWAAFEPGVAQAANIGVFRYRWVQIGVDAHLEGNCGGLPLVVGPLPGICYEMAPTDVPVYEAMDTSSSILANLHLGDYAQVLEIVPGWARVDLNVGNLGTNIQGWIEDSNLNMNGPCESLVPTPTATFTPTTAAKLEFFPNVTPKQIYYRGTGCGSNQAQFYLKLSGGADVIRIDLYFRLKDKSTGERTGNSVVSMNPTSDGGYIYKLLVTNIPSFSAFKEAILEYEFIAVGAKEKVLGRSMWYGDVTVSACGEK